MSTADHSAATTQSTNNTLYVQYLEALQHLTIYTLNKVKYTLCYLRLFEILEIYIFSNNQGFTVYYFPQKENLCSNQVETIYNLRKINLTFFKMYIHKKQV